MKFRELIRLVEEIAPLRYAYDWDNSGVILSLHDQVKKVLVCLDVSGETLQEAEETGCDTIVSHHPLLFRPVKKLTARDPVQGMVIRAVQSGLNLYAAHTSFDRSPFGINRWLAEKLGLQGIRLFLPEFQEKMVKLTVFAPPEAAERIKEALFQAGAGSMGEYSRVCFETEGTGSFLPGAGAHPSVGIPGRVERVSESRLECICPVELAEAAVAAAKAAHPYEEPAVDVYEMALPAEMGGLGCLGELPNPMEAEAFLRLVKDRLGAGQLRFGGKETAAVRRVACVGGSGGEFFRNAAGCGADVLLTGEAKHNHFLEAAAADILLVEAGHYDTEAAGFADVMCEYLQKRVDEVEYKIGICRSVSETRPYAFL